MEQKCWIIHNWPFWNNFHLCGNKNQNKTWKSLQNKSFEINQRQMSLQLCEFVFIFLFTISGIDLRLGEISSSPSSNIQNRRWSVLQRQRFPSCTSLCAHPKQQRETRIFVEKSRYARPWRRSYRNVPKTVSFVQSNSESTYAVVFALAISNSTLIWISFSQILLVALHDLLRSVADQRAARILGWFCSGRVVRCLLIALLDCVEYFVAHHIGTLHLGTRQKAQAIRFEHDFPGDKKLLAAVSLFAAIRLSNWWIWWLRWVTPTMLYCTWRRVWRSIKSRTPTRNVLAPKRIFWFCNVVILLLSTRNALTEMENWF